MKIAVIIADANGLVNAGLDVEKFVKVFDMPDEIASYITTNNASYRTISFATVED